MQGWADDVDFGRKMVTVEESVVDPHQGEAMAGDRREDHSSAELKSEKKGLRKEGKRWEVSYDKLVVTVGCYSQTFGIKGVKENAFFMKDVGDARRIRKRVLECFEIASLPTTSDKLRKCTFRSQSPQPFLGFEAINPGCKTDLGVENAHQNKEATLTLKHAGEQLLCFAVVGGGPTGTEFAAELSDLVHQDLSKLYPALAPKVRIAVHDVADKVLSMFDDRLAKYAMETFRREGVDVKTSHHVQELRPGLPRTGSDENTDDIVDSQGCYTLTTKEDGEVGVGLCVWSTGNMMNPFVQKSLDKTYGFPSASASITDGKPPDELNTNDWMIEKHPRTGAIIVDDRLRVQLHPKSSSSSEGKPASSATMTDVFAFGDNATIREAQLPATAQTASQQALWLAKRLNKGDLDSQRFTFKNMGIMTYLGSHKGLVQTEGWLGDVSGRVAWLIWRGAYWTMSVSLRNKILIPVYWYVLSNWSSVFVVMGTEMEAFVERDRWI